MRSKGQSEQVVSEVLRKPKLFPQLIEALEIDHPGVRMRASDAIEKITLQRPELLKPHKRTILKLLAASEQQELRWHLAQIVPRLSLSVKEKQRVFAYLKSYLKDKSSIVKTFAMQAMADLAKDDKSYRPKVIKIVNGALESGTPAMQSRARKLREELEKNK